MGCRRRCVSRQAPAKTVHCARLRASSRAVRQKPKPGLSVLPDGQITSAYQKSCQAPESKIFRFSRTPNHRYITSIPFLSEGRIMIATNVGRVAVDAGSADNERRESVRQRRVVLTPDMLASSSGEISFSGT